MPRHISGARPARRPARSSHALLLALLLPLLAHRAIAQPPPSAATDDDDEGRHCATLPGAVGCGINHCPCDDGTAFVRLYDCSTSTASGGAMRAGMAAPQGECVYSASFYAVCIAPPATFLLCCCAFFVCIKPRQLPPPPQQQQQPYRR